MMVDHAHTLAGEPENGSKSVGIWLLVCCAMVFGAVVLGGITRLTDSGLSITQWQPLSGIIPPFSQGRWEDLFALYQTTPEFQKVNIGMTLHEFKSIFWWEYAHRLWGRTIGLVFLLPLVWFAVRRMVNRRLGAQLAGLFMLGGLQGGLGWFMVQSGLIDNPDVSHYRLAAHLGLALILYSALLWIALNQLTARPTAVRRAAVPDSRIGGLRRLAVATVALVSLTILSGALVAGTRAGLTYNTFPLMDGRLIPEGYLLLRPWLINPFENIAAIQFNHRVLALTTLVIAGLTWWRSRWVVLPASARLAATGVAIAAAGQVALGIGTLLLVVPVPLAVAHQGFAVVLLSCGLWLLHAMRRSDHLVAATSIPI